MESRFTLPSGYPQRILLAVAGLSPQVITETVFCLAVHRQPAFISTQIRLITSREGAERARLSLLSKDPGWFARLRYEHHLPPIRFDESCICVVRDQSGNPIEDFRSEAHNRTAADEITALVRELTADMDCALHASIAGGRKSLGFYLGYTLSLLDVLKGYSTGGQRSVFECFLSEGERSSLLGEVAAVLDGEDRFFLVRLDPRSRVITLGIAVAPEDPPFFYVS